MAKWLEEYEASHSEAQDNSSNSKFDEFGDDDDEIAALDVDNRIATQKSMISSQLVR